MKYFANASTFRACVSLSNMGVTLLDRQCYRQAQDTLHAAVTLMKCISRKTETPDVDIVFDVQECLGLATHRLLNPNPSDTYVPMMVVSTAAQDVDVSAFDPEGTMTPMMYPIRTEVSTGSQANVELVSAILLHNLGIAYYCRAKAQQCPARAARLHKHATHFFRIALAVVSAYRLEEARVTEPLCLSMATMSSMARNLQAEGKLVETQQMLVRLGKLREVVKELESFHIGLVSTTIAPAA